MEGLALNKHTLQFIWENQEGRITKKILKTKVIMTEQPYQIFKQRYYEAKTIKTVYNWYLSSESDQ